MNITNPNCCNDKCHSATGEVRVLPSGGESNLILCRACFDYEINWRYGRNYVLGRDAQFDLPTWDSLKVYGEAVPYQPKTGQPCHCKPGQARDNCPDCEGTGQRIDFAAIRARKAVVS